MSILDIDKTEKMSSYDNDLLATIVSQWGNTRVTFTVEEILTFSTDDQFLH